MRKLIHLVARLYPARWRERYGPEFDALLDDMNPGFGDLLNIVKEALLMQLKLSNVPLTATIFALVGMLAAGLVSIAAPKQYASTAVIHIRANRPEEFRQTLFFDVIPFAFSDESLLRLIEQNGLYTKGFSERPTDDALRRVRESIIVTPIGIGSEAGINGDWRVSFTYPDSQKAQSVTAALETQLIKANLHVARQRAAVEGMPPSIQFRLIGPPHTAPIAPHRMKLLSLGLAAGALAGIAIALVRRRFKPAH